MSDAALDYVTASRERRHRVGRYIERAFRIVEMTAILALLKVVAEPQHPDLTPRLLLFGFLAVSVYALEPVFDVVSKHADAGWTTKNVLSGALVFSLGLLVTFVVFLGVYELADLIAAFSVSR
jgi:hypothetical protein